MADTGEQNWPRKDDANKYLQDHKIAELFNNMTSNLIYSKPDKPKEFLIEQLEKLTKSRAIRKDHPCLFDETNILSVFSMLDPTGRGHITVPQYQEALRSLGIQEFDGSPTGAEINKITFEIFSREAKVGLSKSSATFK